MHARIVRTQIVRGQSVVLVLGAILFASCAATSSTITTRTISSTPPPRVVSKERATSCAQLSWPVHGWLSSPFGTRYGTPHEGIDLAVPQNTDVHAACDGVVAYAGDKLRGYGRLVILNHEGGMSTVYAHNKKLLVHVGEKVSRGQIISLSGQTGHARGPHVHFEVRVHAVPTDPQDYLQKMRVAEAPAPVHATTSTITPIATHTFSQPIAPAPQHSACRPPSPHPRHRRLPALSAPDEEAPSDSESSTIREIATHPISP